MGERVYQSLSRNGKTVMKFLKKIWDFIKNRNTRWKIKLLLPYFEQGEKVLDFGCGDLSFATVLRREMPTLVIAGIDVVDISVKPKNVKFIIYDGKRLPFVADTFDTVIAIYVFHHCKGADWAFKECLRVAKKRVIFIEAIFRNSLELTCMKLMDWLYNIWKPSPVPLPYQFFTLKTWGEVIGKNRGVIGSIEEVKTPFPFLPIGKAYLFVVHKKQE